MTTPVPEPAFHTMDALNLPREVRDPAFMALIEKGYTIGTVVMLAQGPEGEERHRVGLVMLPPSPHQTTVHVSPAVSLEIPAQLAGTLGALETRARRADRINIATLIAMIAILGVLVVLAVR